MKKHHTIFIFHGTAGSPEGNWFPWLKKQLEILGYKVIVPRFPTPEGESLQTWLEVMKKYCDQIDQNTIMVGHSKGGMFLIKLLERLENSIDVAFIVSAPMGIKPILFYDADFKFANGFEFNWENIKNKAQHFTVYHSDNDPYVCLENGQQIAQNLGVELTFIPQAGHLNAETGYTKFEKLFEDIKEDSKV